jgi:hypothetical protein
VKVNGTAPDPAQATVTGVKYRIGIHQYSQPLNVKLSETALSGAGLAGGSSGGGSCDTGALGLIGLALLGGFKLTARRSK